MYEGPMTRLEAHLVEMYAEARGLDPLHIRCRVAPDGDAEIFYFSPFPLNYISMPLESHGPSELQ